MNVLKTKLYGFCILALGVGGIVLHDKYDTATNYAQVVATVTNVQESCYLTKKEGKKKWTTDEGPCEVLQAINENHSEYQDYRLVRNTVVEYEYQSPADGQYYTGKHKQAKHTDGRSVNSGDYLTILAHKERPKKTKKI